MSTKDLSWILLALRDHATSKWTLDVILLTRDEAQRAIGDRIRNNAEVRWVSRSIYPPQPRVQDAERSALKRGWHRQDGFWKPIEEPILLPQSKHVGEAIVVLALKSILFGSINIEVTAGDSSLDLVLNDVYDSPVTFVRFVQILKAGGLPHAAMTNETWCDFVVSEGPSRDRCRFFVNNEYPGMEGWLDIVTNKDRLADAFSELALQIGKHPFFAHHYLFHGLPMDDYERVADAHDKDWAAGVQHGIYPDDIDAEDALLASRIVEGVTLPAEYAKEAAKYRQMFRSLEIPTDWQLKFGFRPIVTENDIADILQFS